MSEVIRIKPIAVDKIESQFKNVYSKADLYMDYEKIGYAMMTDSSVNKVIYAKAKWSDKVEDVKQSEQIYSCSRICSTFAENRLEFVQNSELFNMICETKYIIGFHAFVMITAGYKIGMACVREVFGNKNEHPSVSCILENYKGSARTINLTEEEIFKAANIYFVYDMRIAASLGYMYYNKPEKISRMVGDNYVKSTYAAQNMSRFGMENLPIDKPAKLMKYLTDFIPIGYSFSGYTPFIFTVSEFVEKLKKETILGLDMVEVPNHVQNSRVKDEIVSFAWYTTKRRLYEVFGYEFDYFSFQFMYRIMCSLFLGDIGYTNAKRVYISNKFGEDEIKNRVAYTIGLLDDKLSTKFLPEIEFNSLDEDSQTGYSEISGEVAKIIMATYITRMFISDMKLKCVSHRVYFQDAQRKREFDILIKRLQDLTWDSIYCDVNSKRENSNELFNYVKE